MDPDLLVFGKHFTSNVRVLPHHFGRVNASEPLASDKRQFIHPPLPHSPLNPVPPPATPNDPAPTANGLLSSTTLLQDGSGAPTPPSSTTLSSPTPDSPHALSSTWPGQGNSETPPTFPPTTAQPSTSPPPDHTSTFISTSTVPPGTIKDSQQPTAAPASSLGRNHTPASESEEAGQAGGGVVGLGPGWTSAAYTLLLLVVVIITVLLSCCCSILLVVIWWGQRKRRMGRYPTSLRGRRGSTRLIKYVLVRENN